MTIGLRKLHREYWIALRIVMVCEPIVHDSVQAELTNSVVYSSASDSDKE